MTLPEKSILSKAFTDKGMEGIIKWDVISIRNDQSIKIYFESASSQWRQGIWLKTDKGLFVNNIQCPSVDLWLDTAPPEIPIICKTSDGHLHVYNIWDKGRGKESQAWTSGMKVEELANSRRYYCNDIGFNTDFNKLVFRIEREE